MSVHKKVDVVLAISRSFSGAASRRQYKLFCFFVRLFNHLTILIQHHQFASLMSKRT